MVPILALWRKGSLAAIRSAAGRAVRDRAGEPDSCLDKIVYARQFRRLLPKINCGSRSLALASSLGKFGER